MYHKPMSLLPYEKNHICLIKYDLLPYQLSSKIQLLPYQKCYICLQILPLVFKTNLIINKAQRVDSTFGLDNENNHSNTKK